MQLHFRHLLAILAMAGASSAFAQTAGFSAAMTSVAENTDTARIILNVNNPGATNARVWIRRNTLSTAQVADYTFTDSIITLAPGAAGTVEFKIPVINDAAKENDEYIGLRIDSVEFGSISGIREALLFIRDDENTGPQAAANINLSFVSSFQVSTPGSNSAEISAYDPASKRLFVANSIGGKLDIVNMSNPAAMSVVNSISITSYGNINSVAVKNGMVALAIENSTPQNDGKIVFMNTDGVFQKEVTAGAMPDMITFSPDGKWVLTANEGEPNTDYSADPVGSVTLVDISGGISGLTQSNVTTLDFTAWNGQEAALKASGVRIFGPGATVAKDLEPEYITINSSSSKAWVTLQENNAIAEIDLGTKSITYLKGLGFKNHMNSSAAMDASNQGGQIHFSNWPVKGVFMPDAIASYTVGGTQYLVTANEGDAREYNAINEAARISSLNLDTAAFPHATLLKNNLTLGRLNVTNTLGDTDGDNDYDELYAFGTRSFSIWNASTGALVYDSGDDFERITANHPTYKTIFNASNNSVTAKDRSDDKGPEPEGVTVASINDTAYAFIALERVGGVMVYNIQNPANPVFVTYANNRGTSSATGDLGAEGIFFIPATQSPTGKMYVVVANEVSSTISVYEVKAATVRPGIASFSPSYYTNNETAGNVTLTVTLNPAPVVNTEFTVKAIAGPDMTFGTSGDVALTGFNGDSLVISVPSGATTATFSVAINDDTTPEATEEVNFVLSKPAYGLQLAGPSTAVLSINTNDGFVGIDQQNTSSWNFYPNPVSNTLYLSTAASGKIYDMSGRLVMSFDNTSQVDVQNLEQGTYLLEANNSSALLIKK